MTRAITHGTWNAYSNHRCRCDACRQAGSRYRKEARDRNPAYARRNRLRTTARYAAALRVAKRYRQEFDAAIAEEERKRGVRMMYDESGFGPWGGC